MPTQPNPGSEAWTAYDSNVLKYIGVGIMSLFIGTVMGVIQVIPSFHAWILATGNAGAWIDPLAHTHMNLVGGVTTGMMGILYYLVPRIVKRPVFSGKLGDFGFWCSFIGAYGFYIALVTLGVAEGNYMLAHGVSYTVAAAKYAWLYNWIIPPAAVMGIGYWTFILNLGLTIYRPRTVDRSQLVGMPIQAKK